MPKYDADGFDPSAPVAYLSLRDSATGVSLFDVLVLTDTGADVALDLLQNRFKLSSRL